MESRIPSSLELVGQSNYHTDDANYLCVARWGLIFKSIVGLNNDSLIDESGMNPKTFLLGALIGLALLCTKHQLFWLQLHNWSIKVSWLYGLFRLIN